MRIQLFIDAWYPMMSGVIRTYDNTMEQLRNLGHQVDLVHPHQFRTFPCPAYGELRLALATYQAVARKIEAFRPDAIHLATEGPIGLAARQYCVKGRIPFTTSYTTKFPEYFYEMFGLPPWITYKLMRWYHRPAAGCMVSTDRLKADLASRGFANTVRWRRGVDVDMFAPGPGEGLAGPGPILLYVGRVAVEKNIEAFLDLDVPGTKYVVGEGPQRSALEARYPAVRFPGLLRGPELARAYAAADAFVFPSRTDTFGLVMLEALASGVPVAAYPVAGPLDVIRDPAVGALDRDLGRAVARALTLDRKACRAYALQYSWKAVARSFVDNLAPIPAHLVPGGSAAAVA